MTVDPYKTSSEIASICHLVMEGRWRKGHRLPVPKTQRVRLTQTEVAERLGVTQSIVSRALAETDGTKYHSVRVRLLREFGGFDVDEEPRWRVVR